jgi:antirestriction protein ArdC
MNSVPTRHRWASRTDFAKITCPFEESRVVSIGGPARAGTCEAAPFGSPVYSKEDLIAKMGAAFLCAEAGISNAFIENQAAFVAGYLKKLRDDRKLLIHAAAQAQHAVDFILNRTCRE